ncbi:hypothetical protein LUZ62_064712 [Rhynchospora pubera]|uniref:Uncharacterized protein n=1 Tax=Rhynchospora pubera TaxID=906938 RepID=A0AAV8EGA6_9POAL|nr:hypothetical protein LUZ62_055991 [Rhynchospora pubera]KAJ4780455.1 hypothetical protein LUZ62_064712 [Rhynchospora pubera]
MASQQEVNYRAGETKGRTEEKTGHMMEKGREAVDATKEKANHAKDKTAEATQAAKERAQEGTDKTGSYIGEKTEAAKQKTGGILQQAGEQVKNVAVGAKEAVKNTLGMGENKDNEKGTTTLNDNKE